MDAFATGAVIFLLLCVITLIVLIVFFPGTSTTTTPVTPGKVLDVEQDDDSSSSSRHDHDHYHRYGYSNSNINTSTNLTFLNELYDMLYHINDGVTTVTGNTSNIYVNNLLSGASGVSTGSGSNASWNNGGSQMVNPNGSYANFTHEQWARMGFSDYDMAAYSPY
jgi:hypothetical protein